MSGITGLGTTYNLPNYTGVLHQLSPTSTPFFSTIGGLSNGGGQVTSTEFEWEAYDLRIPGQNTALQGATAPNAQNRVRQNVTNVVQIHQEKVSVSYTKQAAFGLKAGTNNDQTNPILNEVDWQTRQMLTQMVRDANWSFINGVYQKPTDNTTAARTRGLLPAIQTNRSAQSDAVSYTGATSATDTITVTHALAVNDKIIFTANTGAALTLGRTYYVVAVSTTVSFKVSLTKGGTPITVGTGSGINLTRGSATAVTRDQVNGLAQQVYDNGGINDELSAVFLVNSTQKVNLSKAYTTQFQDDNRTMGGVSMSTIITDFGTLGVMVDRAVPQDTIALVSLGECSPVYLEVPGKGHFFAEPLAKTGASDDVQLYGEVGLAYGVETSHGILTGCSL
ncbi:DUF5309 family protein [Arthrobacter sp. 2RAF6]|uniref:SU10 major capsid protein n=1 Tax=Arthrobacter sp. 2RAF6 TaxID=3233002 RepID=UPI003F9220E4